MSGAVKGVQKRRKKGAKGKCPYRVISSSHGLLCFDPWLAEYVKPSEQVIEKWCRGDFRSCPNLLSYESNMRAGMRKHFML